MDGERDSGRVVAPVLDPDEDANELIAAASCSVPVTVAMDSGSVENVIHPKELPEDAEPVPDETDKHFVGANNSKIERYGECETMLSGEHGDIGCGWKLANVTRALHSVSKVAGPYDGPGKQDVLFNNKRCVVVPPGIVDEILRRVKPVAEYHRRGNLYLADLQMSSFTRQGQGA